MTLESDLEQGLRQLELACPEEIKGKLITFVDLLGKWNRVYNLTAIRDSKKMLTHHILDSLSVRPYLQGSDILDVGSGAGLPGLPLALTLPERHFVLLDSNAKKTRFIQQAKAELGLDNVTVETARAEDFRPQKKFDTVISRAFAEVPKMITAVSHLCKKGGSILAMKGVYPDAELRGDFWQCHKQCNVKAVYKLCVPGLDEQRHIVRIVTVE